jgi:hypothetical protein
MRFFVVTLVVLLSGSFLQADCPEGELICEDVDNYSVMEAEARPRGSHNWMEMGDRYPDFEDGGDFSSGCGNGCDEAPTFTDADNRRIVYKN